MPTPTLDSDDNRSRVPIGGRIGEDDLNRFLRDLLAVFDFRESDIHHVSAGKNVTAVHHDAHPHGRAISVEEHHDAIFWARHENNSPVRLIPRAVDGYLVPATLGLRRLQDL